VLQATDQTLQRRKTEAEFLSLFNDCANVSAPPEAETIRLEPDAPEFLAIPITSAQFAEEPPLRGFLRVTRSIYADDPSTMSV
jgi:hypothetical protein